MPRLGLLLAVLAAATLDAQSGSKQPIAVDPAPKVKSRVIALEPSPLPSTLAQPQTDGFPGLTDVIGISLCDPVACLGDGPRFVLVDGKVTIRFPDSYRKPAYDRRILPPESR